MKFEFFLAGRFFERKKGFSGPLIKIATASITLGVAVMIISVSVLRGFQNEVSQKIVGFGSHILVSGFTTDFTGGSEPLKIHPELISKIQSINGVVNIQPYAYKGGLVKTDNQIQGVLFKGVSKGYDSSFFKSNLIEGTLFNLPDSGYSQDVIISSVLAQKLELKIGDKLRSYFSADSTYRVRAFVITGIYHTGLIDFDEKFVIGDLRQIQKMNQWEADEAEGIEILVKDFKELDKVALQVYHALDYDLTLSTIKENQPGLFSWLSLLNTNVVVILLVMALVSTASIISTLLVMVFEKASAIGVLKTLGCTNRSVRKIFLIKSSGIILRGILLGSAGAFLLCWAQKTFKLFKLNPDSYSMSYIPIDLNPWIFIILSIASFLVCMLALLIPTQIISKVDPVKTIRFE